MPDECYKTMFGARFLLLLGLLLSIVSCVPASSTVDERCQNHGNTSEEKALIQLVNAYRAEHGLSVVPLSASLTIVAQLHLVDLVAFQPDQAPCNAHSWSAQAGGTECCYTPDHAESKCMWDKPRELTTYTGDGFEIAFGSTDKAFARYVATANDALESWKGSPGHNDVLLQRGSWEGVEWKAMGVAVYKGFAAIWFGQEPDPKGTPPACQP